MYCRGVHSAGLKTNTDKGAERAARKLLGLCPSMEAVLVKRGAKGSLLVSGDPDGFVLRQPAMKAKPVVDTTGAGDCFTAAFAVALLAASDRLDGDPESAHAEAMKFAAAAATICVQRQGAMPSMPSRQEVEHLL